MGGDGGCKNGLNATNKQQQMSGLGPVWTTKRSAGSCISLTLFVVQISECFKKLTSTHVATC